MSDRILRGFRARTTGTDVYYGLEARVPSIATWGTFSGTDVHQRLVHGFMDAVDDLIEANNFSAAVRLARDPEGFVALAAAVDKRWTEAGHGNHTFPQHSDEIKRALSDVSQIVLPVTEVPAAGLLLNRAPTPEEVDQFLTLWRVASEGGGFPEAISESFPVDTLQAYLTARFPDRPMLQDKRIVAWLGTQIARSAFETVTPANEPVSHVEHIDALTAKDEEVGRLTRERDDAIREAASALRERDVERRHHQEDIKVIESRFWAEAHERSWCSEAESVINDMNESLHISLESDRDVYKPNRDWTVSGYASVTFEDENGETWSCGNHDYTIEVTDCLRDNVESNIDRDDIASYISDRSDGAAYGHEINVRSYTVNDISESDD